jgi:prevent-host-death family protein
MMTNISLAEAKAKLSELLDRVAGGEEFCITRHGKPAGCLTASKPPRRRIDIEELRRLTDGMNRDIDSGDFMRKIRDDSRY